MSHHSSLEDEIMRLHADMMKLGETGRFPEGHLTSHDEGEIKIGVVEKDGKVILNFGKPIYWIGFNPSQAHSVAKSLRKMAKKAEMAQRERR